MKVRLCDGSSRDLELNVGEKIGNGAYKEVYRVGTTLNDIRTNLALSIFLNDSNALAPSAVDKFKLFQRGGLPTYRMYVSAREICEGPSRVHLLATDLTENGTKLIVSPNDLEQQRIVIPRMHIQDSTRRRITEVLRDIAGFAGREGLILNDDSLFYKCSKLDDAVELEDVMIGDFDQVGHRVLHNRAVLDSQPASMVDRTLRTVSTRMRINPHYHITLGKLQKSFQYMLSNGHKK